MEYKLKVVRRQLGVALALYLKDSDCVSIHTLASACIDAAKAPAKTQNQTPFFTKVIEDNRKLNIPTNEKKLWKDITKFANAFKHSYELDRKTVRDDEDLIKSFDESHNDVFLYAAWIDYHKSVDALPIEAQVFIAWFEALNVQKIQDPDAKKFYQELFGSDLNTITREKQKRRLRKQIEKARNRRDIMDHAHTESVPLVLRGPLS